MMKKTNFQIEYLPLVRKLKRKTYLLMKTFPFETFKIKTYDHYYNLILPYRICPFTFLTSSFLTFSCLHFIFKLRVNYHK